MAFGGTGAAGTVQPATFTVSGNVANSYVVSFPSASITVTNTATGAVAPLTMTVGSFLNNATGVIPLGGSETFAVGATLSIAANQPAGLYQSNTPFSVRVDYN